MWHGAGAPGITARQVTKEQREALPLISNATVNRSASKVLQRLFTFAKAEGAVFENEPKWEDLFLARAGGAGPRIEGRRGGGPR